MTPLYVETSAALAWLLGQEGAREAREAIDGGDPVVTSALTFLEIERALSRGVSEGVVREGNAQGARGLVARHRASWIVMTVTEDVLIRAGRPFPVEPVRTLDALHLATALAFSTVFPDLTMLSLDRRVRDNANALGMSCQSHHPPEMR